MEGYFLPKALRYSSGDAKNSDDESADKSVRILKPAVPSKSALESLYSYAAGSVIILKPIVSSSSALESIHSYEDMTITDNGKCISIINTQCPFWVKSFELSFNELRLKKMTSYTSIKGDYNNTFYNYKEDVVISMFSETSEGSFKTKMFIQCAKLPSFPDLNYHNDNCLMERNIVLEYDHLFTDFHCYMSETENKLFLVSGNNYVVGNNLDEVMDTYLDVVSYYVSDEAIHINHDRRVNVTSKCGCDSVDRIYQTLCGTKLFLVSNKRSFVVVYSLISDYFGEVYGWVTDGKQCNHNQYFYIHHKEFGDMLLICQEGGLLKLLREDNLSISSLDESDINLREYGFGGDDRFSFMHVNCVDRLLIFLVPFVTLDSMNEELFIFDYFEKKFVGKFLSGDVSIENVKSNFSGEEIFALTSPPGGILTLNVLFICNDKKSSGNDDKPRPNEA